MAQGQLNIRVPEDLKENAIAILGNLGLTPSAAVRVFLTQVVNSQSIPFAIADEKGKEVEGGGKAN